MGAIAIHLAHVTLVWTLVAACGAVLLVTGTVMVARVRARERRRTRLLRRVFGPEYVRAVAANRGRARAETDLAARLDRRREVWLRDLDAVECERVEATWETAVALFVESPEGALHDADALVADVMRDRGYPIARFEERAGLISLDHAELAEPLRAAHRVALLADEGRVADTEQMRRALVAFRCVLDALLGAQDPLEAPGTR